MSVWGTGGAAPERPPAAGDPGAVFADYFDGHAPLRRRVTLALEPGALVIHPAEGAPLRWPLAGLRALPDQAEPGLMVLAQVGPGEARVVLADADFAKAVRAAAPALARRAPVQNKGRIAAWAAGAVASVALIIFVLVPTMANQLAAWLPPSGEKALGNATFEQIRTALSDEMSPIELCTGAAGLEALGAMQARLNADKDLPYPVEIAVLDHKLVNAFALPGGRVVVFRGLIDAAENPDEVAAVLAHELGHVVHRDPTRDALRIAGSVGVLGLLFGDFAGGTAVLFLANQLIDANYSQAAEAGADDYAHGLLTEAGLPPAALGTFFTRLKDAQGDAEGLMAHFSTHPQMQARIAAAMAAQAVAEARGITTTPALDAGQWAALRTICGAGGGAAAGDDGADEATGDRLDTVRWDAGMGEEVGKQAGRPGTTAAGTAASGTLGGGKRP